MTVLSIIPGVGGALVWVPAAIIIFFSTLGGLMLFGAMRFILGPILAALFVTVWEMFGIAFRTALAEPASAPADDRERRSR